MTPPMAAGGGRAHLPPMDLLPIYVEDHLALSLAGVRLARRAAAENQGTEIGRALSTLAGELEEDRQVLKDVARALGRRSSFLKETAAVLGASLQREREVME